MEQQKGRLQQAKDLGANLAAVERLNALETQRYLESLSNDQRGALAEYLGLIETYQGKLSVVLGRLSDELTTRLAAMDAQAQALRERADKFNGFAESITETRQGILDKFSPLAPADNVAALRTRFSGLADAAMSGNESALTALPQLASQLIEMSRDIYGSTTTFQHDLSFVTGLLDTVAASAKATADQATAGLSQFDLMQQILDELSKTDPSLSYLADQVSLLSQNNALLGALLQSYVDLANGQSSGVTLAQAALAGLAASLTPTPTGSTTQTPAGGTPLTTGAAAAQAAAAAAGGNDALIDMMAVQIDVLQSGMHALEGQLETANDELRRIRSLLTVQVQAA
ncbi:MAG: hypothetical protein AB7M12_12375 [Hyphomonadaceae bacterium]